MAKLTPQSAVAGESQDGNGAAVAGGQTTEGGLWAEGLAKAQGQMPDARSQTPEGRRQTTEDRGRTTKPVVAESSKLVRGNERPTDVVAFEQAVVGFFVEAADLLGVPKSVAAIYGTCFASPEPLGFSEINERLEISSGSISQGLKVLRDVGALKVSDAPRSLVSGPWSLVQGEAVQRAARQRERYEPDMELRKLALHFIEERLEKQLAAGKGRLEAIHAAVPSGDNGAARELKGRIEALQTWNGKGRSLVPVMKTFLKLT